MSPTQGVATGTDGVTCPSSASDSHRIQKVGKSLIFKPEKASWLHSLPIGTEAMTRRVIKPQPSPGTLRMVPDVLGQPIWYSDDGCSVGHESFESPFKPGELRYVKEPWRALRRFESYAPRDIPSGSMIAYEADERSGNYLPVALGGRMGKLRNPLYMPEWASRTILQIDSVRAERACDISHGDAILEGVGKFPHDQCLAGIDGGCDACENCDPRWWFRKHWESIHGPGSWEWWTWAIRVKVVEAR